MQLLQNYQKDLLKSRTTPLLIELSQRDIKHFGKDGVTISLYTAQRVYDIALENEDGTNFIFIDGEKVESDDEIFLFEELLRLLKSQITEIKNLAIIKQGVTKAISMATGGVVSNLFGDILESGLEVVIESIHGSICDALIDECVAYLDIPSKIVEEIEERVNGTINESCMEFLDALKEDRIYLTYDAKQAVEKLSHKFKENLTPAESFRFILQLILSLSIGMPKVLFVRNPHKLDKNSLALFSLLYAYSKNLKDEGKHTGISVVYLYEDEAFQPYKDVSKEYREKKIFLDEQRVYTQRYAMLERPTSDIPRIAVKTNMFVGREEELIYLDRRYYYSKEFKDRVTLEIISGEPGIGKTKLVKKHLKSIRKQEQYGSKLMQLTLLNQVGHTSSNTGLSSLIDSLLKESARLENAKTLREVIVDKTQKYIEQGVTNWLKGALGVGQIVDIAASVDDKLFLAARIEKTVKNVRGDQDNKSADQKQQQFQVLNSAIKRVQDELSDSSMPIVLFIDDLQWIDEESAEYIVEHLMKRFNLHIVATLRPSDASTVLRKRYDLKEKYPYTIALFKKINIKIGESLSCVIEMQSIESHTIALKGLTRKTLSELISQVILGERQKHEILAKVIIETLNNDKEKDEVNTLFAVETINMLCDKKLYENREIEELIVTDIPLRYNNELVNFQSVLEKTFKILYSKYEDAFNHMAITDNDFKSKFNLMAYAVLEERLSILRSYFKEDGNAAVNTLLFSSWIGTLFDSTIVKEILEELSLIDDVLLSPIQKYLMQRNESVSINVEQLSIIEEVYEIVVRYAQVNNLYKHSHHLISIFLDKQLSYLVDTKLDNNVEAIERLYTFVMQKLLSYRSRSDISSEQLLLYVHNVANRALINKRRFHNMDEVYIWYIEVFDELYALKALKVLEYNLPTMVQHIENEYLIQLSDLWKKNYLNILWKSVSLNDRLFNKDALTYINKMYPVIATYSNSYENIKLKGDFYYKVGGYKYLHVSYKEGLKELLLAVKYYKEIPKSCEIYFVESQANLSYSYGRIGELLQRSTSSLSPKRKQLRLLRALHYHFKSLSIIEKLNKEFPQDMTYLRKVAVVHERIAQTYRDMKDFIQAEKYFLNALDMKRAHFEKTGLSFGYRKILIVLFDFYQEKSLHDEAKRMINLAIQLTNDDDFHKYLHNYDQYEIESYIKIYQRYCLIYPESQYNNKLEKLLEVSKKRGLSTEY